MLIAALLAALFLLPRPLFVAIVSLILVLAGLEWAHFSRLASGAAALYAASVAAVFLVLQHAGLQKEILAAAAVFWLVVAPLWMWRGLRPEQSTWVGAAGFAVLVPAGLAMAMLAPLAVLLVLVLVWIADTAAYFVGRAWGRRKLAPTISPGKTWEGAAGALVGAALYAIIVAFLTHRGAWAAVIATALVLGMASIVGDLFESAAKRQAGLKDSGRLLPGHGGLLDRIDSATAALPLAAIAWPMIR